MKSYLIGMLLGILCYQGCNQSKIILKKEIMENNKNVYLKFEYQDKQHILATAKIAVWLTNGYKGDTILLNPGEKVLLTLPDDEYSVSVGNGNDDVQTFIF